MLNAIYFNTCCILQHFQHSSVNWSSVYQKHKIRNCIHRNLAYYAIQHNVMQFNRIIILTRVGKFLTDSNRGYISLTGARIVSMLIVGQVPLLPNGLCKYI